MRKYRAERMWANAPGPATLFPGSADLIEVARSVFEVHHQCPEVAAVGEQAGTLVVKLLHLFDRLDRLAPGFAVFGPFSTVVLDE